MGRRRRWGQRLVWRGAAAGAAALLAASAGAAGCSGAGTAGDDAAPTESVTSAQITGLPSDTTSLFRDGALYTIVVRGFEPSRVSVPALQALRRRSDRVEGALDSVESTGEAIAEMYLASPGSVACDARDLSDERRFFQTSHFRFGVKGNMSVGQPKPPHRLRFRKKDERLFGLKTVDLNSMYNDPSHVREALAWTMFREADLPASRFAYAKLCVQSNSPGAGIPRYEYRGLFLMLERPDDVFVKSRFPSKSKGNLYSVNMPTARTGATLERRPSAALYKEAVANGGRLPKQTYELDTNNDADDPAELQSYEDLATFVDTLHGETEELRGLGAGRFASSSYAQALDGLFDTSGFLRWAAINTLLASLDNYLCTPSNFRLYNAGHRADSERAPPSELMQSPYFHWIPWDYDNSFGVNYFAGANWPDTPIAVTRKLGPGALHGFEGGPWSRVRWTGTCGPRSSRYFPPAMPIGRGSWV